MTRARVRLIDKIIEIDRHRNGICGEGFHVVKFTPGAAIQNEVGKKTVFIAIVFPAKRHVAVLDLKLANKTIDKWQNAWRGDDFEDELREAIADFEKKERERWTDDMKSIPSYPNEWGVK
jgi:hypothetical protein